MGAKERSWAERPLEALFFFAKLKALIIYFLNAGAYHCQEVKHGYCSISRTTRYSAGLNVAGFPAGFAESFSRSCPIAKSWALLTAERRLFATALAASYPNPSGPVVLFSLSK